MSQQATYNPIPETVDDALALWDAGNSIFTVEMGGLGPVYEQAIQVLAFAIMRRVKDMDLEDADAVKGAADLIVHELSDELGGLTLAQVGAAKNLAYVVCRKGYRAALSEDAVKDRHIQVSKGFPAIAPRT